MHFEDKKKKRVKRIQLLVSRMEFEQWGKEREGKVEEVEK